MRSDWAIVTLAGIASLAAQAPPEGFTLAGRVVDAVTGTPVRRAMVIARPYVQARSRAAGVAAAPERSMLTDESGTFRFADLPAARYALTATRPRYATPRQPQTLTLGPSREGVVLEITPLAAIEGTVTGEDGTPQRLVAVLLLRAITRNGRKYYQEQTSVGTDDRGRFRIANLEPGQYILSAAGRRLANWRESSRIVYYASAHSLDAATPITLAAGQRFEANLAVENEAAFRVSGTLSGAARAGELRFELVTPDGSRLSQTASTDPATGGFVLNGVIAGQYRLNVEQRINSSSARHASADIRIAEADVRDVALELVEDQKVIATAHCTAAEGDGVRRGCAATIEFVDGQGRSRYAAVASAMAGAARAAGVGNTLGPGTYFWRVRPLSGFVTRVTFGGSDIQRDTPVEVRAGSMLPPFEVWIDTNGGQIAGSVAEFSNPPGWVLLVGGGPFSQQDPVPAVRGQFVFDNLAPGAYQLYALSDPDAEYANPDVLRAMRPLAEVKLEAGARQELKLKQ